MNTPKKTQLEEITDRIHRITRGEVSAKIYTVVRKDGSKFFELRWKIGKKITRRSFGQYADALNEGKKVIRALDESREEATALPPSKVMYFAELEKKLKGTPLHVAVEYYLQSHGGASGVTVEDAWAEYWADCVRRDLGKRQQETIQLHIKTFVDHFCMRRLGDIKAGEIEQYLVTRNWSARSIFNNLRTIQSFFKFCQKRHLPPNKITEAHLIEPPKIKLKTPQVFTPLELCRIFAEADLRDLPYLAIAAFGGGRRAEIGRLKFSDIDLAQKIIALPSEITKTNRRRTLDIPPVLHEWLTLGWSEGDVVPIGDPLTAMRERLPKGFWRPNGLRHSFASYHLTLHRNAALTAELAGHSPQMLQSVYKALVTPTAAEEWFAVTPAKVREIALDRKWHIRY
jgi:integrase